MRLVDCGGQLPQVAVCSGTPGGGASSSQQVKHQTHSSRQLRMRQRFPHFCAEAQPSEGATCFEVKAKEAEWSAPFKASRARKDVRRQHARRGIAHRPDSSKEIRMQQCLGFQVVAQRRSGQLRNANLLLSFIRRNRPRSDMSSSGNAIASALVSRAT